MPDEKRTMNALALAIGAGLRSGDPLLRGAALTRLGAALLDAKGNLSQCSRDAGIPLRTLMRWAETDQDVAALIAKAKGL